MNHECVLTYNTNDDGIHLSCLGCGYHVNLGFHPSVEDVITEYRHEVAGR